MNRPVLTGSFSRLRIRMCTLILAYPALYALLSLVLCLTLYSFTLSSGSFPLIEAPLFASLCAAVLYWLSRKALSSSKAPLPTQRIKFITCTTLLSALIVCITAICISAFLKPTFFASAQLGQNAQNISTVPTSMSLLLIPTVILVCLLTGVYEEILFRGIVLGVLKRYYHNNGRLALAVQAAIFASAHVVTSLFSIASGTETSLLVSWVSVLQLVLWCLGTYMFGWLMGTLKLQNCSLLYLVAIHGVYDIALFMPASLSAGVVTVEVVTGNGADVFLFAFQAVLLLALIIGARFAVRKEQAETRSHSEQTEISSSAE